MEFLSAADIVGVHDRVIEESGGSLGVRDVHRLQSIAHRPHTSVGGVEQFPGIFKKAASYLEAIARYHVFVDGNKRTALTVAGVFLALNGYETTFSIKETEDFMLAAARGQRSLEEIAHWLEKLSKKIAK